MRQELIVKTRTLVGVSDLTIAAPIKPGLVPSLEAVTYKSRAKAVLKVLNASRSSSHEYSLLRAFSDSVERVGQIHSVRIAIIDNKVMLAATYDGNFEAYLRVLYTKVSRLLDLIFCNTVGHVGAHACRYEEWRDWVAAVQVETDMFYSTPGLTYDDVQYLQDTERGQRNGTLSDTAASALRTRSAEARAAAAGRSGAWMPAASTPSSPAARPLGQLETLKQGLQALSVLYRLADWYLPGTPDGDYLQRATQDLLLELRGVDALQATGSLDPAMAAVLKRFDKQLSWFRAVLPDAHPPAPGTTPKVDAADIQGGILSGYPDGVTHGALVLVRCASAQGAADLLTWLMPRIWRQQDTARDAQRPLVTVAFTAEGLRVAGLDDADLDHFPIEFRVGMEARCSELGDLHGNHPRRWQLPQRNWPAPSQALGVDLSAVHVIVQLRISRPQASEFEDIQSPQHPLHETVGQIDAAGADVQVLAVQVMRSATRPGDVPREHFGFADPLSNPRFNAPAVPPRWYGAQVPVGEVLLGHPNQAESAPPRLNPLLQNGSFLVVRKLRQNVARFESVSRTAAAASGGALSADEVKARLMGRYPDGRALVQRVGVDANDFNYSDDPAGAQCPLQSHVRRANPRGDGEGSVINGRARAPLITRRGMSFGPAYDRNKAPSEGSNAAPRGIVFMAYNASIAEQFEVIQRWLSGGNSSGIASSQSDPICGVARAGDTRTVRFNHGGRAVRVELDDPRTGAGLPDAPAPLVQLDWGLYLFTPSISALRTLQARLATRRAVAVPWSAKVGEALLLALEKQTSMLPADEAAQLWKAALEDPEERRLHRSASIWAAVREQRGGVLNTNTPYGVLVADPAMVQQVFADDAQRYSMRIHLDRMHASIGDIYLGLDRQSAAANPGVICEYERLSAATNAAIQALDPLAVFEQARQLTAGVLKRFIDGTQAQARGYGLPDWELNLDAKEVSDAVLAGLCDAWFGLPGADGSTPFARGGYRWDWQEGQPPLVPGHLTWPSRYIFQPLPGEEVVRYGERYGQAVRAAALAFVRQHRDAQPPSLPTQPLSKAIFSAFPARTDDDLVARTLVGSLMGFLPTVDGNLRATLNEWLRDGTFWRLRQALGTTPVTHTDAMAALRKPLYDTMQLRPMPELVWRTVKTAHNLDPMPSKEAGRTLTPVALKPGDRVVVAIVSATQRALEQGHADLSPVFGGAPRKPPSQPWAPGLATHACPGMGAGMSVLLGCLTGLLQAPGDLRASPVPLSFTFLGKTG